MALAVLILLILAAASFTAAAFWPAVNRPALIPLGLALWAVSAIVRIWP